MRRRRKQVNSAVEVSNKGRTLPTRDEVLETAKAKSASTWNEALQAAEDTFIERGRTRKALAFVGDEVLLESEVHATVVSDAVIHSKKREANDRYSIGPAWEKTILHGKFPNKNTNLHVSLQKKEIPMFE